MITFVTILGVSLLIVLHELGHYWAARATGMRVHRFSIGFGPALLSRKVGDTVWQLAAVPLGGFVQIQGMGPEDVDPGDGHGFKDRPRWQRALVLAAGPAANWLVAVLVLAVVATTAGLSDYSHPSTTLGGIDPGGAAARAGLEADDRITSLGGVEVADWEALVEQIRSHPDETVAIELERGGQRLSLHVTPTRSGDHGVLGVEPSPRLVRYGPLAAVGAGLSQAAVVTRQQAGLLWGVITREVDGKMSGLPGIVKMVSAQARAGVGRFAETLATLSIVLFIMNLVPIPALDGGRLAFLGIEAVRRRPVSERVETWVHGVGLAVLLVFILFVSVRDLL